jgi:hypothetical protein
MLSKKELEMKWIHMAVLRTCARNVRYENTETNFALAILKEEETLTIQDRDGS